MLLNHAEGLTPAGDRRDLRSLVVKPGRKRSRGKLGVAGCRAIAALVSPRSTTLARSQSRSDLRPIVAPDDLEHPTRWRLQADDPRRRLADGAPGPGDSMPWSRRIANEVVAARLEAVENVAV
jgi:hypothetical protein